MRETLYLVKETALARQWSRSRTGSEPFWVPRSVCPTVTKFAEVAGQLRQCQVEIKDWWVEHQEAVAKQRTMDI